MDENSIWADLSKSGGKRRGRARGESSGEATPVLSIDDSEFEQLFVKVNESQSSKKKKKKKKVGPARHARGEHVHTANTPPVLFPQPQGKAAAQLIEAKRARNVTIPLKSFKVGTFAARGALSCGDSSYNVCRGGRVLTLPRLFGAQIPDEVFRVCLLELKTTHDNYTLSESVLSMLHNLVRAWWHGIAWPRSGAGT